MFTNKDPPGFGGSHCVCERDPNYELVRKDRRDRQTARAQTHLQQAEANS